MPIEVRTYNGPDIKRSETKMRPHVFYVIYDAYSDTCWSDYSIDPVQFYPTITEGVWADKITLLISRKLHLMTEIDEQNPTGSTQK